MNIRYTKLSTSESFTTTFKSLRWDKVRLPVAFLRQQMVLVSIVIASMALFIFTRLFTSDVEYLVLQDLSPELNYGVIVDCGSSGSRAHLFKWGLDPLVDRIELIRDETTGKPLSKHIMPGLSTLKDNPTKASDYMEPIMSFISESIPRERHLDTPIYFMATAGLRLLDDSTQRMILADISRDFRAKYDFPKIKSQVITGELEGLYSWLSLNMHHKLYNISKIQKSYGMIEMGGASTQVTFELNPNLESAILKDLSAEAVSAFKKEQTTLNISPNNSIRLFTTSFLGLGVNSARDAAIDLLVRDHMREINESEYKRTDPSKIGARLKDPCLTIGSSEIVLRPTALLQDSRQSIGFVIKERDETFRVRLEGTGDFIGCLSLLERMLTIVKNEKLNCPRPKESCPISLLGSNFIPYHEYSFVGLSEMFFTTNEMLNSAGVFNRSVVSDETQRICTTQYNRLLEMYSHNGVSREDRILYECFKASWLLTILHSSGFRMPDTYTDFQTLEKLDGIEIDWTLGAMLKEAALNGVGFRNN